jgi:poly(hydroxyalkanoate) granule-associated protein
VTEKNEPVAVEKPQADTPTDQILAVGKVAVETAQEAISKAQEAVDKIQQESTKILESLVREGSKMLDDTQKLAGDTVDEVRTRVGEAKGKAVETLDNLEQLFEERVSRALARLGIPTRDDFQAIAARLDQLNQSVQLLIQGRTKVIPLQPDDLQEISGIGPAIAGKLQANGISTFRQIATLSAPEIERIETRVIHSAGRIQREKWIEQARDLHARKYGETV